MFQKVTMRFRKQELTVSRAGIVDARGRDEESNDDWESHQKKTWRREEVRECGRLRESTRSVSLLPLIQTGQKRSSREMRNGYEEDCC